MDINFQQLMAEAGEGFQPLPPGPYTVECEKAEPTLSKSSQAPQVRVTLRVLGGAHNGRKLFDQFTITAGNPVALGFFFDNMAAFGLDRAFFAGLTMADPMPYVAQMLLGRQCNVSVVMDQYQGVDRNKIKTYRPIQGGQPLAQQNGMPGMIPQPGQFTGAAPVMQQVPQQQPQFPPQGPPPGFPPQQPYVPQQPQPPVAPQPPQMMPQPPMPQVPPVQEQPQYAPQTAQPAPWQQAQEYPPQQPQPQPVAPGEQQAQPQGAPMWQPSGPPPGYVDPNQPQQAPQPQPQPQYQQPPQQPQGVPPMPGRSI